MLYRGGGVWEGRKGEAHRVNYRVGEEGRLAGEASAEKGASGF